MYEYGAAEILRRGYELALSFPKCPIATRRALEAAAEAARLAERPPVPAHGTWQNEPLFSHSTNVKESAACDKGQIAGLEPPVSSAPRK